VERKKPQDLINAVVNNQDGNNRFYDQLRTLQDFAKNQDPNGHSVLIIEGDERQLFKGHKDYPIYNSVKASCAFFDKVTVIPSLNEDTTIMMLKYWQKRETEESPGISIRPKRRLETMDEQLEFIVAGFPSIGGKRAKDILHYFGNLPDFISAELPELEQVLGNKLANKVWEILCANYGGK
jgi:ERCC4-type nuclease